MHAPERALARIDLTAIERNCERLKSELTGGAELCAVVKADGYGHGAIWAAKAALAGGAGWLAVATAAEAVDLRRHGIGGRILIMGALTSEELREALEADADLVVWAESFLALVGHHRIEGARPPRLHVKLDTGMGRLGTSDAEEAGRLAKAIAGDERFELAGLMTHFATADEPGDEHFPAQLERFIPFTEEFPDVMAHAANSAATLRDPRSHFGMVRCGIAVYGLDPFQGDPAERGLTPALSLESYVARVERFEPGRSAGYGRSWKASEPTHVATVPIGYGDGWRRALSNNCDVLIGGRRHPLVGTVSMDNITVDLGAETGVDVGESVTLIGGQGGDAIRAEEVAARLETINYEVTCGLSQRVRRLHVR